MWFKRSLPGAKACRITFVLATYFRVTVDHLSNVCFALVSGHCPVVLQCRISGKTGRVQLQQILDQFLEKAARLSCAPMRAERHLAIVSGFATARAVLMNSSASGLSVRSFKVMIAIVPRALCNSIGNALSEGCLPGNINV